MENKKISNDDRRIHPRIPLKMVVTCTDASGHENVIPRVFYATTHNFSAGGLLIETEDDIPISTILEMKFTIPSLSKSVKILGKVLRCDANNVMPDCFMSGVVFMEVDEEDQRSLYDFIARNCG